MTVKASPGEAQVEVVLATNDPVRLSFVVVLLRNGGVNPVLLDEHISAVEGSIGAFPRRLAVPENEVQQARRILAEAGEV